MPITFSTFLTFNDKIIGGEYAYTRKNSNSYNPTRSKLATRLASRSSTTSGSSIPALGFVYISKAPGRVNDYAGSGDWVKVMKSGLTNPSQPGADTAWANWDKDRLEWTIQKSIPAGEYLERVEHIGLHEGHVGKAQFYIECFQLNIESSGTGKPGPTAKIPGIYSADNPGIKFNKWNNPKSYSMPGPKMWDGN